MTVTFTTETTPADITGYRVRCIDDVQRDPRTVATYPEVAALFATHDLHCTDEDCAAYRPVLDILDGTDRALDVNVSNVNALHLLATLGLSPNEDEELAGDDMPDTFLGRVLLALAVNPADAGIPVTTDTSGRGATWIDCGRREGYTDDKLLALHALAVEADRLGRRIVWS